MKTEPQAFLIDMDGVLFHGERPLSGARRFLDLLGGRPYLFLTNNPILPPEIVAAKLLRMGLGDHPAERVLTSAEATAAWLTAQRPGFRYFAVGADGLHSALDVVGREDPERADFVVVGEGAGLDYDTLTLGINLVLKEGARLVVTNPDLTVDAYREGRHRILPGGGALVAPFAVATGQKPVVIGKPEPLLFEMALERLGVEAKDTLMIGDRPDTDIAGAARLGLRTALVRTGRFSPGAVWPEDLPRPDWDVVDLGSLVLAIGLD